MRAGRPNLIAPADRWLVLLAVCIPVAGGCAGTQKPFADLFKPLVPMTPIEAVHNAFNVYDADVRRDAIALLAAAPFGGEEKYVRMYRVLVDDPDPTVRATCIKALGMHGDVEDAQTLIDAMSNKQESPIVRWEAVKGLRKIHHPGAVGPLIAAADDTREEDADVRIAAAEALGQYPQPAVFQALVGALDDRDLGVALAAHRSLGALTGRDFAMDGSRWLIWAQEHSGRLFEHQQPYTYKPYPKSKGMFDKMKFWKPDKPVEERVPKGLEPTTAATASTVSRP
ncbi:MAG: HEAT repeat domain-containing protein [Phycisphaeraceae bacterium]